MIIDKDFWDCGESHHLHQTNLEVWFYKFATSCGHIKSNWKERSIFYIKSNIYLIKNHG